MRSMRKLYLDRRKIIEIETHPYSLDVNLPKEEGYFFDKTFFVRDKDQILIYSSDGKAGIITAEIYERCEDKIIMMKWLYSMCNNVFGCILFSPEIISRLRANTPNVRDIIEVLNVERSQFDFSLKSIEFLDKSLTVFYKNFNFVADTYIDLLVYCSHVARKEVQNGWEFCMDIPEKNPQYSWSITLKKNNNVLGFGEYIMDYYEGKAGLIVLMNEFIMRLRETTDITFIDIGDLDEDIPM